MKTTRRPRAAVRPSRSRSRQDVRGGAEAPPALPAEDAAFALLIAAEVVRRGEESGEPADRVLKRALREARLGATASACAARGVFAWYRWRNFVTRSRNDVDPAKIRRCVRLAEQFAREPAAFDDVMLLDAALPGWWSRHWAVTAALVRALQREPVLWLRARPGRAADLAAQLPAARVGVWPAIPDAVLYAGEADVFRSSAFRRGDCEIQDVASQAVGGVCAPKPGEKWWDACAGEGGKTLHLADLMQGRGVVWASDRSAARLEVLRRRAARARIFNYRVLPWAGGSKPPMRTLFDGVLVDAPCSGIGTWQRNPHARWTTSPVDVQELARIQSQLLASAALAVRPGGRLLYSVCTLTREETSGVADAFAATHPEFEPAPFPDVFSTTAEPVPAIAWEPQITRGNGMFVAAWRRRA